MQDHHDDQDHDSTRLGTALAIGLVVLALIGILAAVVVAMDSSRRDADEVVQLPGDPDTAAPGVDVPAGSTGGDSQLVGLTEEEVRARYPLVRVAEIDGESRPMTMDLQPGRVNLALEQGKVIGADVEGCQDEVSEELTWAMQACDPSPEDGPTVTGTVAASSDGDAATLVLHADDDYHEGITLHPLQDSPRVTDAQGQVISPDDLQVGDSVSVWISGACAESDPPQCPIGAIVVTKGP